MVDKKKKKRSESAFSRFIQGRWISTGFFTKNAIILLSVMVFTMIYISNKYECQTKMETIQQLEQELEKIKTESIRERSQYMSNIRESAMQQLIDSLNLGLRVHEQPPFVITYSNN